ncbi:mechanosensitive ion channel [Trichocoleus sp. FACHB-262]|uniref:mechanosensitive ion channel n=1 Tax=Trichocoleus sp. FACHB-262 TaxID=2692869 RepID=UPI001689291C|nr:mechanosensitive ion channel [Trichocoleus sp. FACHB-262]MBD2123096.1 mechanosensitive ion channel [Trichocoleus sp. FACHB-262]
MIRTWQEFTQIVNTSVPIPQLNLLLAQAPATSPPATTTAPQADPGAYPTGADSFLQGIGLSLGTSIPALIKALLILVVGLLIAALVSAVVRGLLNRTDIDNKLAARVIRHQPGARPPNVEKWVGDAVFWLIVVFTVVAFLQALNLTAVSQPLNTFLDQILRFLPKLAGAGILLAIAWALATVVKLIVTQGLHAFGLDQRLGEQINEPPASADAPDALGATRPIAPPPSDPPFSLSETIGNALYWFIFLLFLPAILNTLELQGTLQPVQQLLNEILAILPNILAAVLIGAAGWLIAQVVRRIVTNLLAAAGTDRIGTRFGLRGTTGTGGQSLSWIIGTIVYVLILIPTAIAALNALRIDAISQPAISMLTQILNAIPQIFTAALILAIAYVIGKFVAELVTNILTSLGFNNIFYWLGLQPTPYSAPPVRPTDESPVIQELGQVSPSTPRTRTPSEVVGIVTLVGILLFATVAATNVLNFAGLTLIVTGLLVVFGRILSGLVVFAIGLYLANLAFNLIASSGNAQARVLAQTARIAIIAFISAMALQQMGIAPNIVNLAFGLLLGAVAVAIALAFGLGGRDIAAQQTREWLDSFKSKR